MRPSLRRLAPAALCLLTLSLFALPAVAQPSATYYDTVDPTNATTLRQTLHDVIDDHTRFPYTASTTDTWDILNLADEDPNNMNNIIDIYKNASYTKIPGGVGAYNREHSWPKSYGFPNDGDDNSAYTDCHHLFVSDAGYNGSRSNKPFRNCDAACTEEPTDFNDGRGGGTGVYPGNSNWTTGSFTQGTWETWDGRKGDVARAMFYMDIRYEGGIHGITGFAEPDLIVTDNESLIDSGNTGSNESVAYMGMLSVLIQWHKDDPPDSRELWRTNVIETFQGNRNPFIDHPEWVSCLYENQCTFDTTPPAAPQSLMATALNGGADLSWLANGESDLAGYNVYRATSAGGPYTKVNGTLVGTNSYTDVGLTNGTTYYYVVTAVDTSNNESADSNEASVVPDGSLPDTTPPAAPSGVAASAGDGQVGVSWNANGESDLAGYDVYRGTSAGGPYSRLNGALLTNTSYTDTAVTNGTTYFYVVVAVDTSNNESADSSEVSATPSAPGAGNLILSEVLYDVSSGDDGFEWVELYNAGTSVLNLASYSLGNGGTSYTYSLVQLSGTIGPGETFVIGGPTSSSTNANPTFDQVINFSPDFQNSGSTGDGVALFDVPASSVSGSTVPIDAVVYGPNNNSGLIDETGSANGPEVGDASAGSSLERIDLAGAWQIQSVPTPNSVPFAAVNTAPTVTISAPSNGTTVTDGTAISFSGSASDVEDGDLTSSLVWTSNLDGTIGNGGSFSATLSVGSHTITAAVTDSGGLAGSDMVSVTVDAISGSSGDLLLSEVLYDVGGTDDGLEWVEIYNNDSVTLDLSGFSLGSGGVDYTVTLVQLSGTLAPGETFVVGGPTSSAVNGNPVFDLVVNFDPDLQNSGTTADGVALFNLPASQVTTLTVPIDAVIYGGTNANGLVDETGIANAPEVGDAPSDSSIERLDVAGNWQIQSSPSPNVTPLNPPANTAPTVSITGPSNGTTVTEGTSVTFTGTANDSEDGDLSSSIAWSSDLDGALGSGASVSTSALSVGTHTITAAVTDSGGLSGSDVVSVTVEANTAPTVSISAPSNGTTATEGTSVTFTGTANDSEDGDLSSSIAWSSDLDGTLGSGASVSTSALSVGTHTITASVTDSGGLSGSDVVSVTIEAITGSSGNLLLSEVLYDVASTDDGLEWVEIYNNDSVTIDLSGFSLGSGGVDYTVTLVQLSGTLAPGETFVVGGPTSSAVNGNPVFDLVVNFDPDLQNSGTTADGVALFNLPASQVTTLTVPIDAVIYGGTNANGLVDETGIANAPEVGDAPSDSSIERLDVAGNWQIQSSPSPNATPLNPVSPPVTITLTSIASHDGWVRESSENSNVGGRNNSGNSGTGALRAGDNNRDRQYKTVVSFDTSQIPAGATIVSAELRLRRGAVSGTNPFSTHGTCWVDVATGALGSSTSLANSDFEAGASVVQSTSLSNAASTGDWSEGSLDGAGLAAIDTNGTTQMRVYFSLDDNDDGGNDYIGWYSANNSNSANHPQLVVTYQP